ncbi:MAG: zinc-ribbon domain-containing protein [Clostridia bacterium]|nr:zinc-ribbon domain-containing protein [Clostridia bacterium]
MFCMRCGKHNPDDAMFCAYCGARVQLDSLTDVPVREKEPDGEAGGGVSLRKQPQETGEFGQTGTPVYPKGENPAQPARGKLPDGEEPEEPEEPAEGVRVRRPEAGARLIRENGPERKMPTRPKPVRDGLSRGARTIVPRKRNEDLFFDEVVSPEEEYDDMVEEGDARHRIKSAVAAILLLAVLGFAFWFLALPGGNELRARMGLPASAASYKAVGDSYREEGAMNRAADAYRQALARDVENYEYAYLTAQALANAGRREEAINAYGMCIKLKPDSPEPYEAIAALYVQMGEVERAINALDMGYERTGEVSLLKARTRLESQSEE